MAWRTHSEEILCFVRDRSPCVEWFFKWEGIRCKYLHIYNIWFCPYIELGFIGMNTFWIVVLYTQCAVYAFVSLTCPQRKELSLLQHLGGLRAPHNWTCKKQTEQERIHQLSLYFTFWRQRENLYGGFTVALLPVLTSQGKEKILDQWDYKERSVVKSWTNWNRTPLPPTSVSGLWLVGKFVLVPLTGSSWPK